MSSCFPLVFAVDRNREAGFNKFTGIEKQVHHRHLIRAAPVRKRWGYEGRVAAGRNRRIRIREAVNLPFSRAPFASDAHRFLTVAALIVRAPT
ncbi:MAG: hypothetical protein MI923_09690 [Phycisphaerales bacterium]|nr:hypothetical protein [Phycisphaerales bacterium]